MNVTTIKLFHKIAIQCFWGLFMPFRFQLWLKVYVYPFYSLLLVIAWKMAVKTHNNSKFIKKLEIFVNSTVDGRIPKPTSNQIAYFSLSELIKKNSLPWRTLYVCIHRGTILLELKLYFGRNDAFIKLLLKQRNYCQDFCPLYNRAKILTIILLIWGETMSL